MRVTLGVDGECRTVEDVVTAERHGYGTDGVRVTRADGHSEMVPGARILKADVS